MERLRKLQLIQRSLAIRHKLKVLDSSKAPDTHEEIAAMLVGKWELEDELRAIEEILAELRESNIAKKKTVLKKDGPKISAPIHREQEQIGYQS